MAKQQTSLRYIFKINSSRLRRSKWNLHLTIDEAIDNEEVVALSDSTVLRFIREIQGDKDSESLICTLKQKIENLKSKESSTANKKKIKELYQKLYSASFVKSYINVVMENNKDFDRCNKGFFINGTKFRRLLATTGGAKNSTVIYVDASIYDELTKRIENGRDPLKPIVPAKLEAYKALACSASIPVSMPKGILVVEDCVTQFTSDIILIDDSVTKKYPKLRKLKNHNVDLIDSDGYGLISPILSLRWANELAIDYIPSGYCLRGSFTKGMLFTFDFVAFANEIAKESMVTDIWGHQHNINDIEIILTASMLKLWDSYNSIRHYLQCCRENNFGFSVTKVTPKELEHERNLNYQFIQSLDLSDEDIDELIAPTVNEFEEVLGMDINKSLLFMNGKYMSESIFNSTGNEFSKALMINNEVGNDPFIRSKIYGMIKKRINDAKIGVVKVRGNYSIVSGDPFSLCQSIFGLKVTGLLGPGEFYSKYWNDKETKDVACFRAPMTCHNNIRHLRFIDNDQVRYWYQYMSTVTIFNSWDTTAHALNGLDKDADAILTTDNKVILRSVKELDAILCVQKSATKKIVDERDLINSNKNSFGDEIGKVTNRITSMFDVQARFSKESKEYKTLSYRILCGQNYQQNAIDKTKGITSKEMPKEWYDLRYAQRMFDEDSIELRIVADKKPYFFTYIYPNLRTQYIRHKKAYEENCGENFRCTLQELLEKENRQPEEEQFVYHYYKYMPVSISDSVMNRLCRKVEYRFDGYRAKLRSDSFSPAIYQSNRTYRKSDYDEIALLLNEYNDSIKNYSINNKNNRISDEEQQSARKLFKNDFIKKAYEICSNAEELCNIIIDLCYKNDSSKQFAWDICGDQIVLNLLSKNDNRISFPRINNNGPILFGGDRFEIVEVKLNSEVVNEINN